MTRLDPVDVAIVGAGSAAPPSPGACREAAGSAHRLPGARRLGRPRRHALLAARLAARHHQRMGRLAQHAIEGAGRPSPSADYPIDDRPPDFKPLMWSGVGGSTNATGRRISRACIRRISARRTLDGVGDDWPFGYADLEPYYDLNDAAMGVCGLAGDPAYPPKPARAMPPLALGRLGMTAARGFDALGWHWWPVDAAINSVAHNGRAGCNYCGPCQQGCVNRAKASVDVTYWPRAIANGVELRPHCVVQQVVIEAGRATGVSLSRRRRAARSSSRPPPVVVAGNGIGTARLLLASGVDSPALGRNLMFHPAAYARGMFKRGAGRAGRPRSAAPSTATSSTRPTSAAASSAACICR